MRLSDVSTSVRRALKGDAGPVGPSGPAGTAFRVAVSSGGGAVAGNSTSVEPTSGSYVVGFDQNVSGCVATATLATVQPGPTVEQPQPGRITVGTLTGRVVVTSYAADGSGAEQPFHPTVSC